MLAACCITRQRTGPDGGIITVGRARLGAGPAGDRPYVQCLINKQTFVDRLHNSILIVT